MYMDENLCLNELSRVQSFLVLQYLSNIFYVCTLEMNVLSIQYQMYVFGRSYCIVLSSLPSPLPSELRRDMHNRNKNMSTIKPSIGIVLQCLENVSKTMHKKYTSI